jgi:alpha-L-fucosidase
MKKIIPVFIAACFAIPVFSQEKFQPTLESFRQNYQCPDWFRDAKFGIWAHWGPQSMAGKTDWFAKDMYTSDVYDKKTKTYTGKPHPDYTYHLEHYGHPSQFGYKDILPLWKAERFNPEQLMHLYKKAGAKYFVSMGTHHDNFFLWDSKIHRWNAVNMGPKKDIVALFEAAAKKEGLRFGVSEHLAASYTWFQTSHGADKTGPYAGIPYDGANPLYQDLYHPKADSADNGWLTTNHANQINWLKSITELIDNYHPDLLYSDSQLPFDSIGRKMLAHFYNDNISYHNGKLEAVYNCKVGATNPMWVLDIERGKTDSITPFPWQTDTSIGPWFYKADSKYKTSLEIILMLIDIVSKNGNLLLNVVQTPEGDLELGVVKTLEELAAWTDVNGEGIYGTRPWKIYGEGPSVHAGNDPGVFGGVKDFGEKKYSSEDFRFTKKGGVVYAFCLAKPAGDIRIISMGKHAAYLDSKIKSVEILGLKAHLKWKQGDDALMITRPAGLPDSQTITFKIALKN